MMFQHLLKKKHYCHPSSCCYKVSSSLRWYVQLLNLRYRSFGLCLPEGSSCRVITLPKTNASPSNTGFPKRKVVSQLFCRGSVSFRECISSCQGRLMSHDRHHPRQFKHLIRVRIFHVVNVSVKKNIYNRFRVLDLWKKQTSPSPFDVFLVTTGDFTHTPDFGNEILAPVSGKEAKQLGPVWLVQEWPLGGILVESCESSEGKPDFITLITLVVFE